MLWYVAVLGLTLCQLDARIHNLQGYMGAHHLPPAYHARINETLQELMDERYGILELCGGGTDSVGASR